MGEDQTVVPAATVVIFRLGASQAPELLLVQRSPTLSFAGAATVFPGGRSDTADARLALRYPHLAEDEATARLSGIREVLEETGLVLATRERPSADDAATARKILADGNGLADVLDRFGWSLDLDLLTPFARWLPKINPGRVFDTRFYLADIGSGQMSLSPDLGENTHLFWASAAAALKMAETGEIKAIFPTLRNLERLAQFTSYADACAHAVSTPMRTISPWLEQHDGIDMLCIPPGLGYPIVRAPRSQIKPA